MRILLANPRGFCAGVERAIRSVEAALDQFGPPVFVRHEIVHNRSVLARLREKGAVFVAQPSDAPPGSVLVFSAHGVSPAVREEAARCGHRLIDATCPLVTKVHKEARRFAAGGAEILLVGHASHVEVEGTRGEAPERTQVVESLADAARVSVRDPARVAVLTQTTLSVDDTREIVDALRARFPALIAPAKSDICYATQNRQDAVKRLAAQADRVVVVGSPQSSNGTRLAEAARRTGARVFCVESEAEIEAAWLAGAESIGVTAGAAVPEEIILAVVARIASLCGGEVEIEELAGTPESIEFALPLVPGGHGSRASR